jgi:hypothetical protein
MNEKIGVLEFVHKDSYGVAIDVVKKFVADGFTRPILNYSYHTKGGSILATDSHRAIEIKDIHGFKEDYLVNPKNFMFAKGVFPDLYKVFAKDGYTLSINLNKEQIKLWLQLFKSINNTLKMMKSSRHNKVVVFRFTDNNVEAEVRVDSENSFKTVLPVSTIVKPDFEKICFSAEYLRDALEAHFKLNSEQLNIYFHGEMKPILLDDEVQIKTLILPVRTF